MMRVLAVTLAVFIYFFTGCTGKKHFITDSEFRSKVDKQFESRKKLAHYREQQLFEVFNSGLSTEQEEALKFLYAYMPLSDLADYDGDYYLKNINLSLQAREEFTWGTTIPEDIFRHFVLPVRVNNENLDTSRLVFFNELKDRIKGMTMEEAALEVNHWCHEKVNYRASDGRTSSPLASVKTSFGRCGEESTFTVAAMRSVAIPARQVYTPRWAHTDDNHAWVEVYVDGRWQYLGACEPEAVLNKGWFDVPVKRAMMVHTNVMGVYQGDEKIIHQTELSTKINSLDSYTVTKELFVKVIDSLNNPVKDAKVEFRIYNYAEYYPMVVKQSDDDGFASLMTGLGDLQVWASKDSLYGYSRVSVGLTDTVEISLSHFPGEEYTEILENIPPVEKIVESVSSERQEDNNKRLALEDSIRNAYMATFMKDNDAILLAKELSMDTARVKHIIQLSYGNWKDISDYLKKNSSNPLVLDFIESLSEKDIRDTPEPYLTDHLVNIYRQSGIPDDVFTEGILSARVVNELVRPWRSFLKDQFSEEFVKNARNDISAIINWVNDSILISATDNYMGCPISPQGVYELRVADKHSRNIFFVALCRSLGIPAKIDLATLKPMIYNNNAWINIAFEEEMAPTRNAELTLLNNIENEINPVYYIHYTLQKYDNGSFRSLDYEGSGLVDKFPVNLQLEPGYYLLMTGHRRNDGSVVVRSEYFNLAASEKISKTIRLEPLQQLKKIEGTINLDRSLSDTEGKSYEFRSLVGDKGIVLAFIDPATEPTRHVMSDIPLLKSDFEKWGGRFLFVVAESTTVFNPGMYQNLPAGSTFMLDNNKSMLSDFGKAAGKGERPPLPYVLFINSKGEITFTSMGYRIGIGENLLKESRVL